MDKVEIKPMTQEDMDIISQGQMDHTCQGWSVYLNGALVGVAGIAFTPTLLLAFCNFTPEALAENKILIWRTANDLWRRIKGLGYSTLYARAEFTLPNAPKFLSRLGFTHIESSARGEIFRWQS